MEIKILYEDKDIVVIDKPSGISVHADGRNKEETIADWFLQKYPESIDVGEKMGEILRPGIVHRLDRETSGVLILCKNQESHQFIKKQFVDHKVEKIYLALVYGDVKKESGTIDEPIGRSPSDFRRRLAGRGARGEMREAITEYKVLNRKNFQEISNSSSDVISPEATLKAKNSVFLAEPVFSLLEVYPKTGRTHQIRVHMKYLSYPVVCDKLYAPKNLCPQIFGRLMLHAKSIKFTKPNQESITIESPLPPVFSKFL